MGLASGAAAALRSTTMTAAASSNSALDLVQPRPRKRVRLAQHGWEASASVSPLRAAVALRQNAVAAPSRLGFADSRGK